MSTEIYLSSSEGSPDGGWGAVVVVDGAVQYLSGCVKPTKEYPEITSMILEIKALTTSFVAASGREIKIYSKNETTVNIGNKKWSYRKYPELWENIMSFYEDFESIVWFKITNKDKLKHMGKAHDLALVAKENKLFTFKNTNIQRGETYKEDFSIVACIAYGKNGIIPCLIRCEGICISSSGGSICGHYRGHKDISVDNNMLYLVMCDGYLHCME